MLRNRTRTFCLHSDSSEHEELDKSLEIEVEGPSEHEELDEKLDEERTRTFSNCIQILSTTVLFHGTVISELRV